MSTVPPYSLLPEFTTPKRWNRPELKCFYYFFFAFQLWQTLAMVSHDLLRNRLQITNSRCQSSNVNYLNVLSEIKNNYESIFAWDVYEKVEKYRNSPTEILDKVTEKDCLQFENNNTFNLERYKRLLKMYNVA